MRKRYSETHCGGKQSKKLQTCSKRYDFFERFRSFSSTAIDRGIGIGRFGSKNSTFDFCTEMYGAPAKNCSGPENRDASILLGRHIANAMIFSTVFDRFRAPRSIEASASVDSSSKKRRSISVQKCTARQQKVVRAPKTAMRRFYQTNI